nr:MAG TPA: HNH endonuclease bacteriophage, HNH Endonuclease, DNA.52A [Caudoviricetes sp.]
MLKSCKYCGRIHKVGETCPKKPKRMQEETEEQRFRSSRRWRSSLNRLIRAGYGLCFACTT